MVQGVREFANGSPEPYQTWAPLLASQHYESSAAVVTWHEVVDQVSILKHEHADFILNSAVDVSRFTGLHLCGFVCQLHLF